MRPQAYVARNGFFKYGGPIFPWILVICTWTPHQFVIFKRIIKHTVLFFKKGYLHEQRILLRWNFVKHTFRQKSQLDKSLLNWISRNHITAPIVNLVNMILTIKSKLRLCIRHTLWISNSTKSIRKQLFVNLKPSNQYGKNCQEIW